MQIHGFPFNQIWFSLAKFESEILACTQRTLGDNGSSGKSNMTQRHSFMNHVLSSLDDPGITGCKRNASSLCLSWSIPDDTYDRIQRVFLRYQYQFQANGPVLQSINTSEHGRCIDNLGELLTAYTSNIFHAGTCHWTGDHYYGTTYHFSIVSSMTWSIFVMIDFVAWLLAICTSRVWLKSFCMELSSHCLIDSNAVYNLRKSFSGTGFNIENVIPGAEHFFWFSSSLPVFSWTKYLLRGLRSSQ